MKRVVIIEDNISHSIEFEILLEKLDVEITGIYKSGTAALESIHTSKPDFVIIDLLLANNENGFDTIKVLKKEAIPYIICTAYPKEEFIESALFYEAEAFFSKPLDESAFIFKIKKVLADLNKRTAGKESIILKSSRTLIKISQSEILKVETEGNYSYFYLKSNKKYVQKLSLLKIKEQLDPLLFVQCFRSILINRNEIVKINKDRDMIVLSDGSEVQIGYKYRNEIIKGFS